MTKTVLFVHGMFMNSLCWDKWIPYLESKGFKCIAPSWKLHDGEPAQLRAQHPNATLGKLTLDDVLEQFTDIARGLNEKPILIGHSMGGLVAQILLNREVGAAGIALDPAPPQGVFTVSWSFLKTNFPIINPLASVDEPMLMTLEQFQYAFVNTLSYAEQKAAYEKYCLPESRRLGRGSLSAAGHVDYVKTRAPLIITGGGSDHIIPARLSRANFAKYKNAANVSFKEFAGRDHFLIGSPGWQEVADYAVEWLQEKGI